MSRARMLIKLLDEGHIEYRMVGRHRRILASSLLAYQRTQLGATRAAADDSWRPRDGKTGLY